MTPVENRVWPRLEAVIRDTFEAYDVPIDRETTAHDVDGWDSLSNIELIVELEVEFGVTFNTGEMAGLDNVGELCDVIVSRARDGETDRP